ncbi:MAG: GNAT family N-acetyltransferase [Nocardioides sp.]|uniref:GNAT family N-acetyltransferase n=1 Tax=Nocardioides sp. TaxID=35761 RepID=UPI0039E6E230
MTDYRIRPIHAAEVDRVRELRLAALCDESAPIAFLDTYADAVAQPRDYWEERAAGSAVEAGAAGRRRQFVAVAPDGEWVGTVVVLLEEAGEKDFAGDEITVTGGQIVGVYLKPEHRGRGLLGRLFAAAEDWLRERGRRHARLYVHADNARARAAYRRAGFALSGASSEIEAGLELEMTHHLSEP